MNALYETTVEVTGGRAGHARSSDGVLDLDLALPQQLGGDAGRRGTNPEQLFAAGYAACFETALRHVAAERKLKIEQTSVTAHVSLGKQDGGGFALQVGLRVSMPELPRAEAEAIAETVHRSICPYSNAVRGNVPVSLQVV